ncbi:MAG: phosphoribosylanthranilate isomerase [Endomicrobium sp.]|nr:phosphoribosylanthranilate isomerase [Endomicrobium sp.]
MPKIKICGLKRKEDVDFVNTTKPDYIGFVFAGMKRKIDFNTAAKLSSLLDDGIQSIGVFVNDKIENIVNLCKDKTIDLIQLHGDEDETYINELKEKIEKPVIKAIRIPFIFTNEIRKNLASQKICISEGTKADFMLFDSGDGGTGKVFDWNLLREYKKPFFLAGGLNKYNIEEAIKKLNPYCVDLSSGVETDGVKDLNKIVEIIKIVRGVR